MANTNLQDVTTAQLIRMYFEGVRINEVLREMRARRNDGDLEAREFLESIR